MGKGGADFTKGTIKGNLTGKKHSPAPIASKTR